MSNRAGVRAGRPRILLLSCAGLGLLCLLWGCTIDPGYPPPGAYGAPGPVFGPDDAYYGDPFWNAWGGGYYGGFYGRGFGGTRLYHGGGHGGAGASRGGGFHGAASGRHGR